MQEEILKRKWPRFENVASFHLSGRFTQFDPLNIEINCSKTSTKKTSITNELRRHFFFRVIL